MRAVQSSYEGAAAAPHAVSGGGEGGAAGGGGRRGAEGAGGGWRGGAHIVFGLKVGALGDEVVEAVELAVPSRRHEGRESVLRKARRRRHTRSAAAARAGQQGAAGGEGGGRGAEGAGGGWRGSAHAICGIHVHPRSHEALEGGELRHEALEGGEVALLRRLDKSQLRLRAQPSALSASREPARRVRMARRAGVQVQGHGQR